VVVAVVDSLVDQLVFMLDNLEVLVVEQHIIMGQEHMLVVMELQIKDMLEVLLQDLH
tara:strand:+ start:39 stop:209 length:171 start_codon:yes stop_codon:yes gene_type:complete